MRDSKSPAAGYSYFSKSDAGLDAEELRKEVGGSGAKLLGLSTEPDFDHFKRLLHGLDPHSGDQLTAKLIDGRISYWDITATIPKGVTIAIEHGDTRAHDALWEAGRETMADLEQFIATRERKGGAQDNRITGNMIYYGFEHPETRPAKQDGMPDPDRHIHFVIPNVTYDAEEKQWKAIRFRPIMDLRKWFDRRFDMRLASKLTHLGYGIEAKHKAGKYYSWDIKGMPQSVVEKFSRRSGEVEKLAKELGVSTPLGKDKLGATSRLHKREDMTLEDYRRYWQSRVTTEEAREIAEVIKSAMKGENSTPQNTSDKGVAYAIAHEFEKRSVLPQTELEITAMERCMGGARPEEIHPEMLKQGVLLKDGEATTREVLAEESRIIAFAREGRGTMRPLNYTMGRIKDSANELMPRAAVQPDTATLSLEQQAGSYRLQPATSKLTTEAAKVDNLSAEQTALVNHILTSTDRMILVIGDAGTGKTKSVRAAFDAISCPVEMLAPSSDASRGVLRSQEGGGFSKADTVASFLNNRERQQKVRNGVIWVDEAGQLPIRDLSRLTDIANQHNARIVLQGDPKQHKSVVRHGNMMNVLQEYAGLPVGKLTEIWRQRHKGYRAAVESIAKGEYDKAYDKLDDLGYIRQVEDNTPLVDDYLSALKSGKSVLVVAPTHREGDEITAEIRERLKADGRIGEDERVVETLVGTGWTAAERGDPTRYDGTEILQFHRNSGSFRAGDRAGVADTKTGRPAKNPEHYAVYHKSSIALAAGDSIRITANGRDKSGKHKLNNGTLYTVAGFTKEGDIALTNGWVLKKDFAHLRHGYVSTSHAAQAKTVDRVLIAMGSESLPAVSAEQFYVSVSRGRDRATVYTDMSPAILREAIQRQDDRRSATEMMSQKRRPTHRQRYQKVIDRMRQVYRRLRDRAADAIREAIRQPERELFLGR